jgi:hypothetical protein
MMRAVSRDAHHQPPSVLIDRASMGVDVGGDLGPQRRREHLPGAIADDLIEQRSTTTIVRIGPGRELPRAWACLPEPARQRRHLIRETWTSDHPREVRPLSGRPTEGHPRVLIIAPAQKAGTARRDLDVWDLNALMVGTQAIQSYSPDAAERLSEVVLDRGDITQELPEQFSRTGRSRGHMASRSLIG